MPCHAVSKHFLQQVGQALTVGAESIDLARRQPTFGVSRRVVGFDQSRLFQIAREIERDRIIFAAGNAPSRHIDVGNAADGRAVRNDKRLLHQHVDLRELDRPHALGCISDETDIGVAFGHSLDHCGWVCQRQEHERHVASARQLAREIGGCAANFTAGGITHRLSWIVCKVGSA